MWWAVAIVLGLSAGCTSTEPDDGTTGPVPSVASSPPASGPPASTGTTATGTTGAGTTGPRTTATGTTTTGTSGDGSSGTAEPTGTVVTFRTVAPGSAAGIRIGIVASSGSDPFSAAVADSVVDQVEAAGAELIRCDPGANASLALDCARRLATQHVDGWISLPPALVGEALCAAGPQDAPLITVAAAPVSCQRAQVGADDRRAGFLTGQALGRSARLRAGCQHDVLVVITGDPADPASARRTEGILDGVAGECPASGADPVLLDAATQDRAYEAFTNELTALPDDTEVLVAAVDDGTALGAAAAVPAARADRITLAAVGADQRARCRIVAEPWWIGDAALFPDRYGEVVVPALLDAIAGTDVPADMYVETAFVTADSLATFYDLGDCPVR